MWWLISWEKWDAFAWEGYIQGTTFTQEEHAETWDAALARFVELVQDDDCVACDVVAMYNDKPYYPDEPYVLSYRP